MKRLKATYAKNRFGEVLESSQKEDILIERNGRDSCVILSNEKYKYLKDVESQLWSLRAEKAKAEGFIGEKKSEKLLLDLLDVED